MHFRTVFWEDEVLKLIDQTRLPGELCFRSCRTAGELWQALRELAVRGAPAIGVAAAYGAYLGVRASKAQTARAFLEELEQVVSYLKSARPTAVNLFWALDRMVTRAAARETAGVEAMKQGIWEDAEAIRKDDEARSCRIGQAGEGLVEPDDCLLTHCNAGGLATSGYGTALAVMFEAHTRGKKFHVYVDETRPLLQGMRLTAWELGQAGIAHTVICDNMAGALMAQKKIRKVIVGADRIAANGDTANKIGTYTLAVLCRHHGLPFYVAAPGSTFDPALPDGRCIPIEERPAAEVLSPFGRSLAPAASTAYNPAFDVTPAELITAFITDHGMLYPPYDISLRLLGREIAS